MTALTNNFKSEISTMIAKKYFASLKAKLAPWLPEDVIGLIICFSLAFLILKGTLL